MLEPSLLKVDPVRQHRAAVGEIVEVGLLLCPRQLRALEAHARKRGLTTGGIMRQILHDYLDQSADALPGEA